MLKNSSFHQSILQLKESLPIQVDSPNIDMPQKYLMPELVK